MRACLWPKLNGDAEAWSMTFDAVFNDLPWPATSSALAGTRGRTGGRRQQLPAMEFGQSALGVCEGGFTRCRFNSALQMIFGVIVGTPFSESKAKV